MQSFQAGRKFRFSVFTAVVLAFFVTVLTQASAQSNQAAQPVGTKTSLAITTQDNGTRTKATFDVTVSSQNSVPTGTVTFMDGEHSIGSAVVNAEGHATLTVDALPSGAQKVVALYSGDAAHTASSSLLQPMASATSGIADYTVAASSTSLSVTAGGIATTTITVTPENGFNQYVSFSCSGLPSVSSCTFTPTTVSTADAATNGSGFVSTTLSIQTTATSGTGAAQLTRHSSGLFYALTLPGVLALVGFTGLRKRRQFAGKLLGVALLLGITFGLSGCAARYNYFHHGPGANGGTPAGTYTVVVTTSSDNGISSTSHTLNLALTVK